MSNRLKVAMIDVILSLHRRGWSRARIAIELDINRETVARYLKQASEAPKPANAPSGSVGLEIAANAVVPTLGSTSDRGGQARGRSSDCEPWRDIIQSKLDQGLSAPTHLPGSLVRTQLPG